MSAGTLDSPRQSTSTNMPGDLLHPLELGCERRARLRRNRRQRALQRAPQVGKRFLHLDPAALALGAVELLGTKRQRDAEQALEHALVDLAREVEALAEPPGPFLRRA